MNIIKKLLFTILITAISIEANALDAHVHGVVYLDIATDKNQILIMVKSPADSFLGFEHRPKTKAQEELILKIKKQWNSNLLNYLGSDKLEDCSVSESTWKHTFSGKNHSNINAQAYISCKKPLINRVLRISLFEKYKNIHQVELQVLKDNGKIIKDKKHNKAFSIEL